MVGLDFDANNLSARLRRGSYVVVQNRDDDWDWSNFAFTGATRTIIRKVDGHPLDPNDFVIGIDDFAGEAAPAKPAETARRRKSAVST